MGSEALRDLVRAREAAKQDQMRARHRLSKFLLRSGQHPPSGVRPWTRPYLIWVAQLRFTQLAQEAIPFFDSQWRRRVTNKLAENGPVHHWRLCRVRTT